MPTDTLALIHPKSATGTYAVTLGIVPKHIYQLISYANHDVGIQTQTADFINSDGTPGRFNNQESYDKWQKKGKHIYTLLDEKNDLTGIIWFSKEPQFAGDRINDFTFAIRLYGKARGVGLAKRFSRVCLNHFTGSNPYLKAENSGMWLRTNEDNLSAIETYQSLGFTTARVQTEKGKITMVLQ